MFNKVKKQIKFVLLGLAVFISLGSLTAMKRKVPTELERQSKKIKLSPPFPLVNSMGVCYANTVLHCLFQNERFVEMIREYGKSKENELWDLCKKVYDADSEIWYGEKILRNTWQLVRCIYPNQKDAIGGEELTFLISMFQQMFVEVGLLNDPILYYYQDLDKNVYKASLDISTRLSNEDGLINSFIKWKFKYSDIICSFKNGEGISDFSVKVMVVPLFNLIVIDPTNLDKQKLQDQFCEKIKPMLIEIWKNATGRQEEVDFLLKGISVDLEQEDKKAGEHALSYVNHKGNWRLCDDIIILDVGEDFSNLVNHVFGDVCSFVRNGKFVKAKPNIFFFEICKRKTDPKKVQHFDESYLEFIKEINTLWDLGKLVESEILNKQGVEQLSDDLTLKGMVDDGGKINKNGKNLIKQRLIKQRIAGREELVGKKRKRDDNYEGDCEQIVPQEKKQKMEDIFSIIKEKVNNLSDLHKLKEHFENVSSQDIQDLTEKLFNVDEAFDIYSDFCNFTEKGKNELMRLIGEKNWIPKT